MTDKTEAAILLCGNPGQAIPGSVEGTCADCGCKVVHMSSDPDVPTNAIKLCVPCGMKRIAASEEVPQWIITKQNVDHLKERGWHLKKGTVH